MVERIPYSHEVCYTMSSDSSSDRNDRDAETLEQPRVLNPTLGDEKDWKGMSIFVDIVSYKNWSVQLTEY